MVRRMLLLAVRCVLLVVSRRCLSWLNVVCSVWFVVCCVFISVCCLLCAVWCMVFAACCSFVVKCCSVLTVRWPVAVVGCSLFVAGCRSLLIVVYCIVESGVRCALFVDCWLMRVVR